MSTERPAQTHIVTARISVQAVEGASLAKILDGLKKQISGLQEDPWQDGKDDADWWVGCYKSDVVVVFENVGEALAAEAERQGDPS